MFTGTCTGCAPALRDPSAEKKFRLSEDVWRPTTQKRTVRGNLLEAPVQELAESAGLSDLAEHRLDDLLAKPVRTGESPRLQHHPRQRHEVRALLAGLLDPARRVDPPAGAGQKQRRHHPRVIRRIPPQLLVVGVDLREIQFLEDHVPNEVHEVVRGHQIPRRPSPASAALPRERPPGEAAIGASPASAALPRERPPGEAAIGASPASAALPRERPPGEAAIGGRKQTALIDVPGAKGLLHSAGVSPQPTSRFVRPALTLLAGEAGPPPHRP